MKHVNDPVPSVLDTRPDAPIRLATLIERCLAKQPADRPASMDEVVAELEAVQAELDAREDGEGTMIMRKPPAVPRDRPSRSGARARDRRTPLWLLLLGCCCCSRPRSGESCSRPSATTRPAALRTELR